MSRAPQPVRGTSEIWNPRRGAVPPLLTTARRGFLRAKTWRCSCGLHEHPAQLRLAWPLTSCLTLGPFSLHLSSLYHTLGVTGLRWFEDQTRRSAARAQPRGCHVEASSDDNDDTTLTSSGGPHHWPAGGAFPPSLTPSLQDSKGTSLHQLYPAHSAREEPRSLCCVPPKHSQVHWVALGPATRWRPATALSVSS